MAIKKISELVELTVPAVGDLFLVTDISEASDANKSKKITFARLVDLSTQVSGLPTVTALTAADLLLVVQAGVASKITQANAAVLPGDLKVAGNVTVGAIITPSGKLQVRGDAQTGANLLATVAVGGGRIQT